MSENTEQDGNDVEGHRALPTTPTEQDDTTGHIRARVETDEDDVEGHGLYPGHTHPRIDGEGLDEHLKI